MSLVGYTLLGRSFGMDSWVLLKQSEQSKKTYIHNESGCKAESMDWSKVQTVEKDMLFQIARLSNLHQLGYI